MGVQTSVQVPAFNYFGYTRRSGIAGPNGNSMFNFLQNCHPVSHSILEHFVPYSKVQINYLVHQMEVGSHVVIKIEMVAP